MIHFQINKVQYQMPSQWQEVNVETFERLAELDNDYTDTLKFLAALSGVDYSTLMNAKESLGAMVTSGLKFIADQQPLLQKIPHKSHFVFEGKGYKVPKDMELERFGQKIMMQQRMSTKQPHECIAFAVALYMQPIIDGKFDEAKIADLEAEVKKMSIIEIYPLANFFFSQLKLYRLVGRKGFQPFL